MLPVNTLQMSTIMSTGVVKQVDYCSDKEIDSIFETLKSR